MCSESELTEGNPFPLGASWVDSSGSFNFALYSRDATAVTLLLYGADDFVAPIAEIEFRHPENKTGRVWHRGVPRASAGNAKYYAYRVNGPNAVGTGQRFDPQKILLDPYARGVFFPPEHSRAAACMPGSNAGKAPLGVLPERRETAWQRRRKDPTRKHALVIYELHVRGFTRRPNSGVAAHALGTFAGVVAKIPYLKDLGVTAVELLPIHQFDPKEGNYFGYMTLSFFSPHIQYSSRQEPGAALEEFRWMVDELHGADIEVLLDVVYNHTTEADLKGPTYSFRGIDNSVYYALDPSTLSDYVNHSGCGNDLRTSHPAVRQLITDSLRYWTEETSVDGFRFDLASIFAFSETGDLNLTDAPIISEITGDPDLARLRLIAEPWAADDSGYVMGRSFPGNTWHQWNDHFRDTVRSFLKGDPNLVDDLKTRLYGSTDLFPDDLLNAYRRSQSVNFVDCHDSPNLCDLVSFTNGQFRSWNCGYEGTLGVPDPVARLRRQQVKNYCCLLMLSNGTPMFLAGDEFMNTQGGNANPYDEDNESTWLDWTLLDANADIRRFFKFMIQFRKSHCSIGRDVGWGTDVTWLAPDGSSAREAASHALGFHLRGGRVGDLDIVVLINGYWEYAAFGLPDSCTWRRVADTSMNSPADIVAERDATAVEAPHYVLPPRSIAVLINP
jgi:glycogen operon protein